MESLPKGLVTTSARVPSYLEDPSLVDAGDIAHLWKVYHSNPSIHHHDAGLRLENFFWRVWGNQRLRHSLHGSALAKLFSKIADSPSVAPAVVQPLKKMTTESLATKDHIDNDHIPVPPPPSPPPETHPAPLPTPLPTPNSNENGAASRCPLPPILKKPNSTHTTDSSQKKARLLLTGLGGHNITRQPSNPLTPVSPPPFAVPGEQDEGEGGGGGGGDNITVTRPPHHPQKRPYFVAGKAGKRRPVLVRRKSSQSSVPTLLRSEVRTEGSPERENLVKELSHLGHPGHTEHGLDRSQDVEEKVRILSAGLAEEKLPEIHISPAEQEQDDHQDVRNALPSPPTENPIEPHPSEDPLDTSTTTTSTTTNSQLPTDFVSGLKLLLAQNTKPTKSNTKSRPRYTFPCSSIHRHSDLKNPKPTTSQAHPPPTKLVDDHFRVRFAEELQREEMLLKTMKSLPEDERNAVLDRYSQSVSGHPVPEQCKQPRTRWVAVPDDEPSVQDGVHDGDKGSSPNGNYDDDDDWVSATGNTNTDTDTADGGWIADDAQASYPDSNLDSVPFKFEGMSYTSSSRAASRLRAPGQLTVLLRAEQDGFRAEAGLIDG